MKNIAVVAIAVLILIGIGLVWAQEAQPGVKTLEEQAIHRQTICPIRGGLVNLKVFADFSGKRVYFCCDGCQSAFNKNPAKYIAKLEMDGITLDETRADPAKKATTDAAAVAVQDHNPSAKSSGCCK